MAYLVLMTEGQAGARFSLETPSLSIGRSPKCDIYLEDPSVSFEHANLVVNKAQQGDSTEFSIKDSNSTNGTYVNNEKVEQAVLQHNDSIVIGLSTFKFVDEAQSALEATQQIKKSWIPGVFYLKDKS